MRYALLALLVGCASHNASMQTSVTAYPLNDRILQNADVRHGFAALVRESAYGWRADERAAFLVLDAGQLRLVEWPARNQYHAVRWEGAIPNGTVAIAHTHPLRQPMASAHDCSEAQRLGIPIFVLTRESVVLIDPRDGEQDVIGGAGWLTGSSKFEVQSSK